MVKLTRLNRMETIVNSDLVQYIDTTPDTVITLVNGEKIVVLESADVVVEKIIAFRRQILSGLSMTHHASGTAAFAPHLVKRDPEMGEELSSERGVQNSEL